MVVARRLLHHTFPRSLGGIPITAPTVSTSPATDITATTARLNGSVTDTGGENPTVTIYWGLSDGGTNPAAWDHSSPPTSPSQPQGAEAFYKDVSGLSPSTKYYFNAKATNSAGTGWGTTREFTTLSAAESRSRSYGGASYDSFAYTDGGPPRLYTGGRKVFKDGDFLYAVGFTESEGLSTQSCLIIKFNIADLSIARRKIYYDTLDTGYNYHERFSAVFVDGDYVYAAGYTNETGFIYPMIIKFNKSDLSVAAGKLYEAGLGGEFLDIFVDGNYVYAVGWEYYPSRHNCFIAKFDKSDLSVDTSKIYYGAGTDHFTSVFVDGDYVYAVGYTNSEGQGDYDCLIIKFQKSDLSIAARKVYGSNIGWGDDMFYRVIVDGGYVYAVGITIDQLVTGSAAGLITKFDKTDLSVVASKFYSSDISATEFLDIFVDGNYLYVVGDTWEEGQGGTDCLIIKFNKADLSIDARKVYGGTGNDVFSGICVDTDYVYAVGNTSSVGEGLYDCLVFRATKASIPNGSSVPAGFVCNDSALTLGDPTMALDESGLTLDDLLIEDIKDSDLALDDSDLTLSAPYVIS